MCHRQIEPVWCEYEGQFVGYAELRDCEASGARVIPRVPSAKLSPGPPEQRAHDACPNFHVLLACTSVNIFGSQIAEIMHEECDSKAEVPGKTVEPSPCNRQKQKGGAGTDVLRTKDFECRFSYQSTPGHQRSSQWKSGPANPPHSVFSFSGSQPVLHVRNA